MSRIVIWIFALCLISWSCKSDKKEDVSEEAQIEAQQSDEIEARRQKKRDEDFRFITGQFDPSTHPDFVLIDPMYGDKDSMYLQSETYEAYKEMYDAAQADGINLVIRSATRNFDYQKGIWERKWSGETLLDEGINASEAYPDPKERAEKILEWSSMPGTSRHHWGTDIDINAFNNAYFESGAGKRVYDWMLANASDYGFCQPYTEKGPDRPWGYNEEKWHWSYQPLAKLYLSEANASLKEADIQGFDGAETAQEIMVVQKYVLGINPDCY